MKKKGLFLLVCSVIIIFTISGLNLIFKNSKKDILPILLSIKNHEKPLRTPGTFAEDFLNDASKGKLTYIGDSAFSFEYNKSKTRDLPFAGVWFPLENVKIDFSQFDYLEIGIHTKLARRIAFNLSVQNKKETHQYITNYIEVKDGITNYSLPLDKFLTPSSWYIRNNINQEEIPKQDLSKVEALSLESCQLLKAGTNDSFIVDQLVLKKETTGKIVIVVLSSIFIIVGFYLLIFKPFSSKQEVVYVPIKPVEYKKSASLEDKILDFLAQNYTNSNLTLNDLKAEFGKGSAELSKLIKEQTKMTFPKYLSYLRIEEAKKLLLKGDFKTVSEIGYAVGFNSPSNFIRVFKTQEGISPKKYVEESSSSIP